MAKLIIDDREVIAAQGASVLEAARSVGIPIPHFCWHPALGKAGACRVCAVKMLDGPVKGIQMSCMLEARDGMVVSTTHEEAVDFRRQVIEWLMLNHPHDCPVCDEGGECLLQDLTIAGGHGRRRYTGKKRTHRNQQLGPYITHEMNRCIQCYRCVRFYQEIAGGTDFGVMGSAGRVYYGRFENGTLQSPFSGNILDLCPTGVFTDKTARFRARYWDFDTAPSLCPHCSLGCNTTPAAHYRELLKVYARRNDRVNGYFICDTGRFANAAVNDPQRPRSVLAGGRKHSWPEALDLLAEAIRRLGRAGDAGLAVVGSSRLSLEALSLLAPLCRGIPSSRPCFFVGEEEQTEALAAVADLRRYGSPALAEVGRADLILLACADLLAEAPMLALAVRQAWRNGAAVYMSEADLELGHAAALPFTVHGVAALEAVSLAEATRPLLIGGRGATPAAARERLLAAGARPVPLFRGANGCAAALLAEEEEAPSLRRAVEEGGITAIIAVEADIPTDLLARVDCLAALDWHDSATVAAAGIILPTTAWVEMDGTYINNEGRAQRFRRVMRPGLPLKGLNPALHPPRQHGLEVPGGDLRPASLILRDLGARLGLEIPEQPLGLSWTGLDQLSAEGEGMLVIGPDRPSPKRRNDGDNSGDSLGGEAK